MPEAPLTAKRQWHSPISTQLLAPTPDTPSAPWALAPGPSLGSELCSRAALRAPPAAPGQGANQAAGPGPSQQECVCLTCVSAPRPPGSCLLHTAPSPSALLHRLQGWNSLCAPLPAPVMAHVQTWEGGGMPRAWGRGGSRARIWGGIQRASEGVGLGAEPGLGFGEGSNGTVRGWGRGGSRARIWGGIQRGNEGVGLGAGRGGGLGEGVAWGQGLGRKGRICPRPWIPLGLALKGNADYHSNNKTDKHCWGGRGRSALIRSLLSLKVSQALLSPGSRQGSISPQEVYLVPCGAGGAGAAAACGVGRGADVCTDSQLPGWRGHLGPYQTGSVKTGG
ncbi:spidroin-1-like [Gopherus flavomarginatus]|uniref:spidroin-1-like n=1 Tax=Gopherus flavomarginatus TaxID=286002 RepID=UPI0021CBE32D|nr:spidroin-1-like [Gopherus flavomarginatus]